MKMNEQETLSLLGRRHETLGRALPVAALLRVRPEQYLKTSVGKV